MRSLEKRNYHRTQASLITMQQCLIIHNQPLITLYMYTLPRPLKPYLKYLKYKGDLQLSNTFILVTKNSQINSSLIEMTIRFLRPISCLLFKWPNIPITQHNSVKTDQTYPDNFFLIYPFLSNIYLWHLISSKISEHNTIAQGQLNNTNNYFVQKMNSY